MGERLSFRPALGAAAPAPVGTTRLVLLALGVAAVIGGTRWRWLNHADPFEGELVEVRGAIPRPGYYRLVDPTVHRAIEAAGGAATGADAAVPAGARVEVGADGAGRLERPSDPLLVGLPLDPNTADAAALDALPGVGEATAAAVVAWREAHGPLHTLQDLRDIPGTPPDLGRRIAPFVDLPLGGPPDVNLASARALEQLPGIGEVLAGRIVADRVENGPFPSLEALTRVPGVRPSLVTTLREAGVTAEGAQ
ncbi:MAG: helix-hairpin-helix domain-containing protein [Myxococcota bacterium]